MDSRRQQDSRSGGAIVRAWIGARESRRCRRAGPGRRRLDERIRANRHYEFFWYPADDCAFTKTLNPTDRPRSGGPLEAAAQGSGLASAERERVDDSWRIFPVSY